MARRGVHIRGMSNAPQMAEVAALVGDPARANILCALLGGRALTATELSFATGVTPQTDTVEKVTNCPSPIFLLEKI
jgi:DNA-binding transcriptional ArsR family regulator